MLNSYLLNHAYVCALLTGIPRPNSYQPNLCTNNCYSHRSVYFHTLDGRASAFPLKPIPLITHDSSYQRYQFLSEHVNQQFLARLRYASRSFSRLQSADRWMIHLAFCGLRVDACTGVELYFYV